jgi:hypothetical protein
LWAFSSRCVPSLLPLRHLSSALLICMCSSFYSFHAWVLQIWYPPFIWMRLLLVMMAFSQETTLEFYFTS